MSNITVKNISSAKIYLSIPTIRFSRELMPGREIPISEEEYKELTFDPGCSSLIEGHFIKICGLAKEEQAVVTENVFGRDEIEKMFDESDIASFAKFIPTATAAEKETIVELAVNKKITNNGFVMLIKKYCDVDIINAINMKHQAEEK